MVRRKTFAPKFTTDPGSTRPSASKERGKGARKESSGMKEYGQSGLNRIRTADETSDRDAKTSRMFNVASYNVRTLADTTNGNVYITNKLQTIVDGCEKYHIEIVAIQEHRQKTTAGNNIGKMTTANGWTLAHTDSDHHSHGVAILYSPKIDKVLSGEVVFKSKRIIAAHLKGNPKTCIISAYAPTESSKNEKEKDAFYKDLEDLISSIPPHTVVILAGDFNAQLGKDSRISMPKVVGPNCYHDETNGNGQRLLNLCKATNIRPTHTHFQHKRSKLGTYQPVNEKYELTQIDHIMISTKWWKSITNSRSYNSIDIGSDHKVVCANFRLSLRNFKRPPLARCKFNSVKLEDQTIREEFNKELKNKFSALFDEVKANDKCPRDRIQTRANTLNKALIQTSEKILGKQARRKQPSWVSPSTLELIDRQFKAKLNYKQSPNRVNKTRWRKLQKEVSLSYEKDQREHLAAQLKDLESAALRHEYGSVWKIVGYISQKPEKETKVRKLDGSIPNDNDEILIEWRNYFSNLLNNKNANPGKHPDPAAMDLPDIETAEFTRDEIVMAIRQLKGNKAPGPDYAMTAEVLKNGGDFIVDELTNICRMVYKECHAPSQWTSSLIVPLPKKGNLEQMTNYRGISLMSIAAKVYNRVLLNRIRNPIDQLLRKNQAGFRIGRSCIQQIHILRRIIDGAYSEAIPLFITFVDFKKAFDSIDRDMMFAILRHYGIPEKIVKAIRVLYDNSTSQVFVKGLLSDPFDITTGVLQGDVLAPFLFIIVMDYVIKRSAGQFGYITHKGEKQKQQQSGRNLRHTTLSQQKIERRINDLTFADDISLLENSNEEQQKQLDRLKLEASFVGLEINTQKTVQMRLNLPTGSKPKNLQLNGEDIEFVEEFKYLGSYMSSSEKDVNSRISLAWSAFDKLKDILRSHTGKISNETKFRLFNAACISVLLYGCESWVLLGPQIKKLDVFHRTCLRIMLGIRQSETHMTNEELYSKTGQRPISQEIRRRQLQFTGHCLRMDPSEPANTYVLYTSEIKSGRRGKHRTTYLDQIAEYVLKDKKVIDKADAKSQITRYANSKPDWNIVMEGANPSKPSVAPVVNAPDELAR